MLKPTHQRRQVKVAVDIDQQQQQQQHQWRCYNVRPAAAQRSEALNVKPEPNRAESSHSPKNIVMVAVVLLAFTTQLDANIWMSQSSPLDLFRGLSRISFRNIHPVAIELLPFSADT